MTVVRPRGRSPGGRLTVVRRVAIAVLAPLALGAQSPPAGAPRWGPNGNGTLAKHDDALWILFRATKIAVDDAKGEYRASFPRQLQQEEGKPYRITGYMLAVDPNWTSPRFVLTRYASGCPFCPPSEPTEAIEIHATKPVPLTLDPVTVSGTLHLATHTDKGLFFSLDGATVT